MQRGKADKIARGNHRGPRDVGEIARELRPEAGLGVHVLAHRGDAEVLQLLGRVLNAALHIANGPPHRQNGQVVLTENRAPCNQFVARDRDGPFDLGAPLVGSRNLTLDLGDLGKHGRAVLDREGLGDDELTGDAEQAIEHARSAVGRVFADRDDRSEPRVLFGCPPPFQGFAAKGDTHPRKVTVQTHARQQHWHGQAGIQQRPEELAGLGID
jgi:hypothetical protein